MAKKRTGAKILMSRYPCCECGSPTAYIATHFMDNCILNFPEILIEEIQKDLREVEGFYGDTEAEKTLRRGRLMLIEEYVKEMYSKHGGEDVEKL